jgi:hypothetical protein
MLAAGQETNAGIGAGVRELQRYASVLLITPSQGTDLIPAIKGAAHQYTSRTEGEPGTFAFRTFVQVCNAC